MLPVVAKLVTQTAGEHYIAVLLAFALIDANHHALAVNVRSHEVTKFGNAKSCRVGSAENRAVFEVVNGAEKAGNLGGAQDDGEFLGRLWERDAIHRPCLAESGFVNEAERGGRNREAADGQLLGVDQVDLLSADFLGAEPFG